VALNKASYTGRYLAQALDKTPKRTPPVRQAAKAH